MDIDKHEEMFGDRMGTTRYNHQQWRLYYVAEI